MRLIFLFSIIFFLSCSFLVEAFSPDPPTNVHQYITNESGVIWPLIPFEIKSHLFNPLNKSIDDEDYDAGDDIILGSGEEDRPSINTRNHLWNPDAPNSHAIYGFYDDGVGNFGSAYRKAVKWWKTKVIPLYLRGDINQSYYWFGRVVHLLEDQAIPAHAHVDAHPPVGPLSDTFEDYSKTVFNNYHGASYSNKFYYYEDLPNTTSSLWAEVDASDKDAIELFRLFWFTAQRSQYFASDNKQGNDYYVNLSGAQKTFNPSLWSGETVNLTANTTDQVATHLNDISNAEIPHAMRAVAGLYRLFWDAVQIDWPTDHHDYRRTGFTLLKGDVNKASDIDASNVALKQNISSDILIRPSISDIDGNGHQEVVTVFYELSSGGTVASNTEIHAIERRPKWYAPWQIETEERWKKEIPLTYPYLPPTLANIDADNEKEVLVGLKNGTLIAYDITNDGWGIAEKWRYNIPEKYSAEAGMSFVRYGGGTAVADIDLDGNYEVITADAGQSSAPDWPGEVYILDGTTGAKEGNATFGNGGAFGSVSVANVDNDDNPEIIVPSFYGVFVYDYNSSATDKLTKKCDTTSSGGVIDGSAVVYDIDRDNQYELIYTTANQFCHASKSCSNKLYIKNAQTCADEGPSPISLSVYSRVTPTIANLDSDSNYEIVISSRLDTQSELGEIFAYDASTGGQEWGYDEFNTLKTSFVAPDIADMNGDGRYDIIFGENNGSKVYIINGSGKKNFTYNFNAFVDSALAIADIDGDGKAEIALKREGSPYGILAVAGGFNQPPQLGNISNITARVGALIDLNASGEVAASDPNGNALTFSFSSPFNSSGKWQTTVNDTGNYSIMVEVSDGSLTDFAFIDVYVFNQTVNFVGNFSDGASSKLLNYIAAANKTVSVRLPKNATIAYSRLRLEGKGS
ncbi:VCBS repeat-containing protein [Candidatus Woesearchaeota archaeon]|nr:VCBS repeat-containing protein [Candidatus Woesearchaeota archaeon]